MRVSHITNPYVCHIGIGGWEGEKDGGRASLHVGLPYVYVQHTVVTFPPVVNGLALSYTCKC